MKELRVEHEEWEFCSRSRADRRVSIAFAVESALEDPHVGYEHCRRVLLFASDAGVASDGLPSNAERARLLGEERLLTEWLQSKNVDCRKVGRISGHGNHELVFQVEDTAAFDARVST